MKKPFILILCVLLLLQTFTGFSFESEMPAIKEKDNSFLDTVDWHGEYDVIVLGYGGAGATASIQAADEGSRVLLLEKAPLGQEGGNTRFAGQAVLGIEEKNIEQGLEYFKHLRGKYNTPSDDIIYSYWWSDKIKS